MPKQKVKKLKISEAEKAEIPKQNFKSDRNEIEPLDEDLKIAFEPIMGSDDFTMADVASVCDLEAMTAFIR
jgi:hypothetical protein